MVETEKSYFVKKVSIYKELRCNQSNRKHLFLQETKIRNDFTFRSDVNVKSHALT